MTDRKFQFSVAPEKLWQAINPWTFMNQGAHFGLVNVNLGQTPRPDIEQKLLDEVGSYGRQLGRIGDALEVLIDHVKLDGSAAMRRTRSPSSRASSPRSARSSTANARAGTSRRQRNRRHASPAAV